MLPPVREEAFVRRAMFAEALPEGRVCCNLCGFRCVVPSDRRGDCGVRENRDGTLYSLVYGRAAVDESDPIEKKPLYHFLPGTSALPVATVGCNFRCRHCLNYVIALFPREHGAPAGAGAGPGGDRPAGPAQRVSEHGLHVYRTRGLFRVRLRHGAGGRCQ